jgi:hypothetical protein
MQGNKGFVIRHEKGRNYPALVCEECGEVIKNFARGEFWL